MSAATRAITMLLDSVRPNPGSQAYENGRRDALRAALMNVKLAERDALLEKAARFDRQVKEVAEKTRIPRAGEKW